jgi:hypothetical protein
MTPKRNDPCPCGSGKLYKHCCKPSRRERHLRQREIALAPAPQEAWESDDAWLPDEMQGMLRDVRRHASPEQVQELERLLKMTEEVVAYEEMHDEIDSAMETLEAHRAEFEALDPEAAMDRAERLFSEEQFRPMRFTAEDVHRAFEEVGYPQRLRGPTPQDADPLHEAILFLVDEDLRRHLSRKLMMLLPEYVSAGRYLDAWIIQYSAFLMFESPDRGNPFLGEMFHYGFAEWAEQVDTQPRALLEELGMDPSDFARMSPSEMEAWLEAQLADPESRARFDATMAEGSAFGDQAHAEYQQLQFTSLQLLEHDEEGRFLLAPEELDPWIPTVVERLAPFTKQALEAAQEEAWDDPEVQGILSDVLFEVALEMAPAVFTRERLDALMADLAAYSRDLTEAGDKEFALHAHLVYRDLIHEEAPGENRFLVGVCMASLLQMLVTLSEQAKAEKGQ